MSQMTSRERLLKTINHEKTDYLPCCFMSFSIMRKRYNEDRWAAARAESDMGLDPMLFIPSAPRPDRPEHPDLRGLPVRIPKDVKVNERRETVEKDFDILHKEYVTPKGNLTTSVRLSDDWLHGDHIPFLDDYQVARAKKALITAPEDLDALKYMLMPPSEEDAAAYEDEAAEAHKFCKEAGALLAGGWGIGMDMANWLCGMEDLMMYVMEQPGFVADLLTIIHNWNKKRMEVILSGNVDLFIRRAWYEGCDFINLNFYRQVIMPQLKAEVELAHANNAKFGYICTSGSKPLVDCYLEAGVDVFIGIDPVQGTHTDLTFLKETIGDEICLWGGVSAAITVERGTQDEIRRAVHEAVKILGPDGLILSPIDNLTVNEPQVWENIDIFIDEWKKQRQNVTM